MLCSVCINVLDRENINAIHEGKRWQRPVSKVKGIYYITVNGVEAFRPYFIDVGEATLKSELKKSYESGKIEVKEMTIEEYYKETIF